MRSVLSCFTAKHSERFWRQQAENLLFHRVTIMFEFHKPQCDMHYQLCLILVFFYCFSYALRKFQMTIDFTDCFRILGYIYTWRIVQWPHIAWLRFSCYPEVAISVNYNLRKSHLCTEKYRMLTICHACKVVYSTTSTYITVVQGSKAPLLLFYAGVHFTLLLYVDNIKKFWIRLLTHCVVHAIYFQLNCSWSRSMHMPLFTVSIFSVHENILIEDDIGQRTNFQVVG